jgi:hypothetical protein
MVKPMSTYVFDQAWRRERDRLAGTGLVTRDELDRSVTVMADPATFYVPPLMVSAWGRRSA